MRGFYTILTSITLLVHFWRLPYLIMENGGGAFLILYFLCLFGLALPVFIAEMSFEKIFGQRRSGEFVTKMTNVKGRSWVHQLLKLQLVLQIFIWMGLFQYFLFIASLALIHFQDVAFEGSIGRVALQPSLGYRLLVSGFLFACIGLTLNKKIYSGFIWISRRALPLCLAIFVVILFQILSVGSHVEGIKTMLYPDFFKLRGESLMEALSHAFLSMALGMGWQKLTYIRKMRQDIVSIAINVASLSALFALFAGLLAIPMIEQTSEKAFGANWLFFILPRWLMYGEHGHYYCLLFFVALFFVSYFLSTQAQYVFSDMFSKRLRLSKPWVYLVANGLVSLVLVVSFYQENWWALWDQSLILNVDRFFVDLLLPINALITVVFLFIFSHRKQRKQVMLDQKIIYNAENFFRYWQITCCVFLPIVMVLGWVLAVFA